MVNLNICARCPRGNYEPSRFDQEGRMTAAPSVECEVAPVGLLLSDSDLPQSCLYILEQRLTEDEAWDNMFSVHEEFYEEAIV